MTLPRSSAARASSVAPLALALAACATDPAAPRAPVSGAGRLEQEVAPSLTLALEMDLEPRTGDTVHVRSVVRNRGAAPVVVTARICSLDIGGAARLEDRFGGCDGYSMHGPLAPGDSIVGHDRRVVESPPGTYPVTVRHLLEPERTISATMRVRPR